VLDDFGGFLAQRRLEVFFPAQDRARRSDGNTELARNHLRLGPFAGTGCAKKNESSFHLSTVKKDRHSGDNNYSDADIEPHQCAARRRFPPTIGGAIK
jgi:hypothetical protein